MRIVLILFSFLSIQCHTYAAVNTNFSTAWSHFMQDPQLSYATFSLTILDNSTGNIIFSHNENLGLAPASTLKTVTGAAALHYLGTDYRYKTILQYSGNINSFGILNGYIYIVGSGDPSLGSWRWNETKGEVVMERWLNAIRSRGIKECRGVVVDLSAWPDQTQTIPSGYPWGDLGNHYGTGHSALNWRENQFRLFLSPGSSVGDPVTLVYVDRPPPSVTLINEITTGAVGTGDRTNLFLAPDGTHGYLRGTLSVDTAKNFSIGGAVPNSALFVADELRQGMQWSNSMPIKIIYRNDEDLPKSRITLDIHVSPPMSEIIYWFERVSINMYGEALIKTIAYAINTSSDTILSAYCNGEHGIEQAEVATIDGSGLSPENRITTRAIARVLHNVRKRAPWFTSFEQALPIINNIRMKSGYIHNALSYAGYVNNQVFSIITNNFNGQRNSMRQKLFDLLDTLS
ncbi:unnamed protein product [Adineta ricciae]|uniref:D-alanyl-D-alanine carboxypeptidase/D-alanyl-D-alanine-endopeptidase n=1 Tax=Adineta ricciae TaxID=249248 RepID=A0A813US77_ADIRI|nr:unnamed protein product [Adineta ricciae]CAF1000823.1 unnamed protein product [Adineta ricciae]